MTIKKTVLASCTLLWFAIGQAQTFTQFTTTEGNEWQQSKVALQDKATQSPLLAVTGEEEGTEFRAWGTCFNELDWDTFNLLTRKQQDEIMSHLFSPNGDIRFTRGRLTMNANDYSREWYSCDDVWGDLELRYFNIEHDKHNVIGLIRAAQHYQPNMTFWVSPWSPPVWMKINGDYPVLSSKYNRLDPRKDYLLYSDNSGKADPDEMKLLGDRNGVFPRRLASRDFFIQDPSYLQAYANMFCRFIELYQEQDIPIDMVMYQNEAYSYTPYPGCAWTAEGTIRFNRDYLAPTLQRLCPNVKLYLGTFNTNRQDYIEKILEDQGLQNCISGIGMQWEARQVLPNIRKQYPNLHYVCTESECGNGAMDWKAGEHTFFLLADNLGNGCDEYYIWNFLLTDNGISPWGWTQNALIQVNSTTRQHRYTAEYHALKHFSHYVVPSSRMLAYTSMNDNDGVTLIAFQRPDKKFVVVGGNFTDEKRVASVKVGKKFLNIELQAHSFNTFVSK